MAGSLQRVPSLRSERTRARLLAAVAAEIEVDGDFGADGVARRAGTSIATFYNHFPSKQEALRAAYGDLMGALLAHVDAHCRIERVLVQGLEAFLSDWVADTAAFFARHSALFRLAQPAMGRGDVIRTLYLEHQDVVVERYRRFVELGQAARVFRQGDAEAIARWLLVTSEGWFHPAMQRLERGDALHEETTRALHRALCCEN